MSANDKLETMDIAALAATSAAVTLPCACAQHDLAAWTRVPLDFPDDLLRQAGTLVDDPYGDPTYAEFHPDGTTYWSPDAPIAPRFYPYNRCSVFQCSACGRCFLKYVEAGGYYVEPRIRALDPRLVIDPAP
jgi:hypothetical protein